MGLLIGRDQQREALAELLAHAAASRGGLGLLMGAAGIGKTRLAEEAARVAESFDAVWTTCGPLGGAPPFWPWRQAIRDILDRHPGKRAPALAALVAGGSAEGEAEEARARMFEAAVETLDAASQERPLLVVFDDLHEADPSSLLLLAHTSARIRTRRVCLLGTWRTATPPPSGDIAATVFRLARRIPLGPLDAREIGLLLEEVIGHPPPQQVIHSVHRRSSGNPLIAHEIAELLQARDGLEDTTAIESVVPGATLSIVAERMTSLSNEARLVCEVAAALGTNFSVDVLAEATGSIADDLLAHMGEASRAGVLGEVNPRSGSFVHDLIRDAVYDAVSLPNRARHHATIGRALEQRRAKGHATEVADLARHHWLAGPLSARAAVRYAREAGDEAMRMLAYEQAVVFYDRAAKISDGVVRAEIALLLGEARAAAGDRSGSRATFLDAAAQARAARRPDLLAAAALGFSGSKGFEVSLLDREQIDLLEEALAGLGQDDLAHRALLEARLSVALSFTDAAHRRDSLSEDAVNAARRSGDDAALAQALAARSDVIAGPDHRAERETIAAEILDIAARLHDAELELLGRRLLVVALLERGDVIGADLHIRAFAAAASRLRQPQYAWLVPLWRGMRALMEGRIEDCREALQEAERIGAEAASENARVLAMTLGWVLAGELAGGHDVEAIFERFEPDTFGGVWPHVALSLAVAQEGRVAEAHARLDAIAPRLGSAERDSEWLPMMAQAAEVIEISGGHPVAERIYNWILPYRSQCVVEGIGAAVRGSVERHLGILAASLGHIDDDARAHFEAALEANEALGAGLLVARTLFDAGVALNDAERLRDARRRYEEFGLEERVREIDRLLGAPSTSTEATFRCEGDAWRLSFTGTEVRLRDVKGLHDLARLLRTPGVPVSAVELFASVPAGRSRTAGPHDLMPEGDLGEVLDARAREAYRRRLAELDEEHAEAEANADLERAARAAAERDALVEQLTAAHGLGRRPRRTGDPVERARSAVTARIRDAIRRITAGHPDLGTHLSRTVRTGRVCVYEPDKPVAWRL